MIKRVLSMLLIVCIMATMLVNVPFSAFASTTVTRAEWISNLVDTFSMTVENGAIMPDNYFGDISPDMECYNDILLAVEFGVIDLEAGEDFNPNSPATREFAAQTLNFCLDFQFEEEVEYTFSEAEEVTYADDIQVAINRGWFALSNGNFLPEQAITSAEATAMLVDAAAILENSVIEENYESQYTFAEGVVVVPQGTDIDIAEDYTVTITDYDANIKIGDVFVVYSDTIPVALVATAISKNDNVTTVSAKTEGVENAITFADSEGVTDVDLEDFTVEEAETFSVTDTETQQAETLSIELQSIDYDKSSKTLTASKELKVGDAIAGSVSIAVSNMKLHHKEKISSGDYEAYITAETVVTKAISFDFNNYIGLPSSINLGYVTVGGVGKIQLDLNISLKGGITEIQEGDVTAGFEYSRNDGFRIIKGYHKTNYSFTAEAEVNIGLKLTASIDLTFVNGSIWVTVGVKGGYYMKDYTKTDGQYPLVCETIKAHLYATLGVSAFIDYYIDKKSWSKTQDIYTESNSPARVYYHYEDGRLVDTCARGETKYTTGYASSYFNPPPGYARSTYTAADGSVVTLWTYSLDDDNKATITGYGGKATALAIPSTIDGYDVVAIGYEAFYNNKNIKSVTMPESITTIGNRAFDNCTALRAVTLSKNLTTIGEYAFRSCKELNNIEIPLSLTSSKDAFVHCDSLKNVTFEEGRTHIPSYLFYHCTGLEEIVIPDTVVEIGWESFYNCDALTSVTLPESVTTIRDKAFDDCGNLPTIDLPPYLTTIGEYAFRNCKKLNNIEIPLSLTSSDKAFVYCDGLKNVTFEEGRTHIPSYLFYHCTGLEEITIPDTVVEIGWESFYNCDSLTSVTLPESVTTIRDKAFDDCGNLPTIDLPPYLTTIGDYAFRNCDKLNNIKIPMYLTSAPYVFSYCDGLKNVEIEKGITALPSRLFSYCTSLEEITIPDTVTALGYETFYKCSALKKIDIPDTVTEYSNNLFEGCSALEEFEVSDKITKMGTHVFENCSSLKKIKLSNSYNIIPQSTFQKCSSLIEVDFPDTLTRIDGSAFNGCSKLESITLPETLRDIGDSAFSGCSKLTNLKLPISLKTIGSSAFHKNNGLTEIVIPENVTEIGNSAFKECSNLTSITISDNVTSIGSSLCASCPKLIKVNLGKGITVIPSNAFSTCTSLTEIKIPRFCKTIESNAFINNTKLVSVHIPESVTAIEETVFSYPVKMTVYGKEGSYAQEYAKSKNMTFSAVNQKITDIDTAKDINIARYSTNLPETKITPEFDTDTITFTSSDENIVTVSQDGKIYGKKYGTAVVTMATAAGVYASVNVVVAVPATGVSLNTSSLTMETDEKTKLTATLQPADSTDEIMWSSSNPAVATVDTDGNVTAVGVGSTTIIANAKHGVTAAVCNVKVTAATSLNVTTSADMAELTFSAPDTADNLIVYFAAYNSDKILINAKTKTLTNGTATVQLPTSDVAKYKAFLIADGFKPVGKAKEKYTTDDICRKMLYCRGAFTNAP